MKQRLLRLRKSMREAGLDALIVSPPTHIRYLTGFTGTHGICIVKHRSCHLVTDGRYREQCRREVRDAVCHIAPTGLLEFAAKKKLIGNASRVGFEAEVVTYAAYRSLKRLFPGREFVPTSDLVENISITKDVEELRRIRMAVGISDTVFREVLPLVKPGVRELDIAAEISYRHRKYGAEGDAFDSIVAGGWRGALPHARASDRRIKSGELLVLDFGCVFGGYHSDITRTVGVGRISRRLKTLYAVVRNAQDAALAAARAGMMAKDLDAVARRAIAMEGLGKFFMHSLGHGIGLQIHERPRISRASKERLETGSVITIEPGVYIPSVGGVRLEDDVLLTDAGCEVLSKSTRELVIL